MRRFFPKIRHFLAIAAAFFGLGNAMLARAETTWKPNSDDAVLFDVRLGQFRLGEGVRGYQTPHGTCVDFADTIMALDLPIRLDKKLRRATGWVFAENQNLIVDRENNTVQIVNRTEKLATGQIFDAPEGWCIDSKALGAWLGVSLQTDLANALLVIKSKNKLPVELAVERRDRAAKFRSVASFDLKSLPQSRTSFSGIKPPAIDVNLAIGGQRNANGKAKLDVRYELYASGEVGPVAYDVRLASDQRGLPDSLRLKAYRTDPDGKLLGPLKATEVAAGDVIGLSTPLVSQSSIGRGAMITNRPLDRPDRFDSTDFRGAMPAGWDAELYRNGQLLAFAINRSDGRYEFLDVPLLYGQNRFEVVLYGPQGQIRREEKSQTVGMDSIPPRKTYYWAGINQDGRDLIGVGHGPNFGTGGWRGSFGIERGLNTKTSVSASVHSLVLREVGRRNYAEASVRRAFGPMLVELSGSSDLEKGAAIRAQVLAEFGKTYFSAESIHVRGGFRSDRITRNITGIHSVSADQTISVGRSIIPIHAEAKYTTRATGQHSFELESRMSANIGRYNVTGQLGWRKDRAPFGPDPPSQIQAGVLTNGRIGRVRVRGEARFRLSPQTRFESATLVGEWSGKGGGKHVNNWRAELAYDQPLNRARVAMGYIRQFEKFALTASAEAATDGAVAAGLNLSFSLGVDPRRGGGIRMTSSRLASHGQVLARVFRDANGDGVRQADEPYEKDVQLAAGRVPVDRLTDANGEVIIDGIQPFQPVLIGIDASSLPDPLIQPASVGIVVSPRPGISTTVDLPLVSAGEVDGTLIRSSGVGLEGVDLELVDRAGRAVAHSRSDFDGFFLFERVPYGQYSIRVAKLSADAAKLGQTLSGSILINGKTPSVHLGTTIAEPSGTRTASGQ